MVYSGGSVKKDTKVFSSLIIDTVLLLQQGCTMCRQKRSGAWLGRSIYISFMALKKILEFFCIGKMLNLLSFPSNHSSYILWSVVCVTFWRCLNQSYLDVDDLSFCHTRYAFHLSSMKFVMHSSFALNQSSWNLLFSLHFTLVISSPKFWTGPTFVLCFQLEAHEMSACHQDWLQTAHSILCASASQCWQKGEWIWAFYRALGQYAATGQFWQVFGQSSTPLPTDIMSVPPVTDYIVKQMPHLRSEVHPSCLIFIGLSEESVGDHQVFFCTKGQQEEIIGIHFSKAMVSQHPFPVPEVITNFGIIVCKQEKLVIRSWFYKRVKVLIEILCYLFTTGHIRGMGTNNCHMVRRVERKVEINQLFIDVC